MMAMPNRGTLHVTLVSATLSPSSAQDPADSYATLVCGKQHFTTRTAKGQGTLPTWNETYAFELGHHDEFGFQALVIEIFAARPELNELLGTAKLSLCQGIPTNQETSLYPLSRPHEGECGQVKVALKWESHIATTTAPTFSGYEQIEPTTPTHTQADTQPSAPVHPHEDHTESYYGEQLYGDDHISADSAASALAALVLNRDKQHSNDPSLTSHKKGSVSASNFADQHAEIQSPCAAYLPGNGDSNPHQPPEIDTSFVSEAGSYPPYSSETPGPYPPQGLPYLTSPIGGVVTTGTDYDSRTPAYSHPPFEITSKLKESDSVAQQYGLPATAYPESNHQYPHSPTTYPPASVDLPVPKNSKVSHETTSYSGAPVSQPESYPPAFQLHATDTGTHSYPNFTPYGAPLPAPSESYLSAASYPPTVDFSGKAQNPTQQETGAPAHYGGTPYPGAYTPESSVSYPPNTSFPSSGQFDQSTLPSVGYPGQENAAPGKDQVKLGMNALSQGTSDGETQDKGFHAYLHPYPPEGYTQPYYPPAVYPQYGYPPQNIAHGYHPQGYPPPYAPPHIAPGFGGLYPQYGHQVPYGVTPTHHGHYQQHGHYQHHGGHGGHHGGHQFKGHYGGQPYGQHSYGGHKNGHGYYGHKSSYGHGGYGYGHQGHHGGHHKH